jgi:hypothetical protein
VSDPGIYMSDFKVEAPPNADLMRSLGRLVRGLSALFWGLPAALIVCFTAGKSDFLRMFGILPSLICTGLLLFGLWQLGAFQRQERVWRNALDRARILALVNFGLSPFLYWSDQRPGNTFFAMMVVVMTASGLLFLVCLNFVLRRLAAMLPDEALRLETRQFTALNLNLLSVTALLGLVYLVYSKVPQPPLPMHALLQMLGNRPDFWVLMLLVPLVLLPLAMTMALLWKTKEVILDNVFSAKE